MKSLYLAGFDVFREDALDWGKQLKALCAEYGFEGLYPLDKQVPAGLHGPEAARWIYDANIALIRQADMVMANLDDFRGPGEPDSGTAFEVGFAVAARIRRDQASGVHRRLGQVAIGRQRGGANSLHRRWGRRSH